LIDHGVLSLLLLGHALRWLYGSHFCVDLGETRCTAMPPPGADLQLRSAWRVTCPPIEMLGRGRASKQRAATGKDTVVVKAWSRKSAKTRVNVRRKMGGWF
jgi:hypothetical protein